MSKGIVLTVLIACLIVIGTSTSAWAAQLDTTINPNNDSSPFKMSYQKTIFIDYPDGGDLYDALKGKDWTVQGTADSSDPGVQDLIKQLNNGIIADRSQARISDLNVSYDFHLIARNPTIGTSIDYRVVLEGMLTDYVIVKDSIKSLVDLNWRGLSTDGKVVINGVDINHPINLLRDQEPDVHAIFAGTEADTIFNRSLINADYILEQPITNWHFLFDPTGINVDAGTFGLNEEISGFIVSKWTMGESSIREGRQVESDIQVEIISDERYIVRSVQSADQGNLSIIGFGSNDILDGIEIAGITPTAPPDLGGPQGGFPIMIVYGMAGIAAIAGIGFFIFSNRSLKNEKQGQQGIDPTKLVGYATSASSGGYQTNRGEAQLKDDTGYQQTRNVYDANTQSTPPPPPPPPSTTTPPPSSLPAASSAVEDAACGCAASADMGSECDCAMQSACLCDATCGCNADICKEQAHAMS